MSASGIKPLKDVAVEPPGNGLVTAAWVYRMIRRAFAKLNITGTGCRLEERAPGNVHIVVDASALTGDHPFKVERASGSTFGVTVQPGLVFTNTLASGLWTAPVIGGVSLLNDPAPVLTANATESHICLVVEIGTDGKATNLPWEIEAFNTTPSDTTLIRLNSASGTPRAGKYHILIASIYSSTIYQWTRLNIGVELQWEVLSVRA